MRTPWLGLFLLLPLAHAQTVTVEPAQVDTTLYFHVLSPWGMPINTQRPPYDPAFTDTGAFGPSANTLSCLDPTTGPATGGLTSIEYHRYYGYSSPGFVEYDRANGNGAPRTHSERGLAYDLDLLGEQAVMHWFMEASPGAPPFAGQAPPPTPAPLANIVVQAVVQESNAVSIDDLAYGDGDVLMQGETRPVTVVEDQIVGDGADQVVASQVDGRWVYEFVVPLAIVKPTVDMRKGYTVQVAVRVDNPACDPAAGTVMVGAAQPFADAAHGPRLELRNAEPLRVTSLQAESMQDGPILVTALAISPWGNYDVDVHNATLSVTGPSPALAERNHTIQRLHEYAHKFDPTEVGWRIDPSGLADGRYEATYTVQNLQRTATATASLAFLVEGGRVVDQPAKESPTAAAWVTLLILGLAVAIGRRRA